MKFKDKNVLIVGSTGGIGKKVTEMFHNEGANLILFSRNTDLLSEQKKKYGERALIVSGDALSEEDLTNAVGLGNQQFGEISILFHAVGSIVLKPTNNLTPDIFRQTLELNLVSPFISIKAVLPDMLKNGGSIVVTSSVAGSKGLTNHEAIAAAKGGLESFVKSFAITYAKKNIRINAVALGLVDTPLASFLTQNKMSLKASENMHPMGRIGQPGDVVGAVSFLASDEAEWITGSVLSVDGGMAAG
ncbi:MAG: short-chain dehydrogenase [Melioribacteraceae bacterium]|nr:MAG: short-chain dehydrogenase [Melioribacteraceae bacterium]